jgi:hypothetical protein
MRERLVPPCYSKLNSKRMPARAVEEFIRKEQNVIMQVHRPNLEFLDPLQLLLR